MVKYFVVINDTDERIPLFKWSAFGFKTAPQLHLATNDLAHVTSVFVNIEKLTILDADNNIIAVFTEYDGYNSISYLGVNFSSQNNEFMDELVISLTQVDLINQVQRLDKQVNQVINTDTMDLEEFKNYKIGLISQAGEQIIFNGTDVTLLNGVVKRFTYNLEDQSNLLNAIFIIQTLGDLEIYLPYHSHGEPCELYNAKDILAIYFTLQFFSTRIQTEINMKLNWIRACDTKEEVEAITIDTPLPEVWAEHAEAIIGPTMELAKQVQETYFGPADSVVEGEN